LFIEIQAIINQQITNCGVLLNIGSIMITRIINFKLIKHFFFSTFFMLIFAGSITGAKRDEEDIRWQETSLELDSLPFNQNFIDSLKAEYQITPHIESMRSLSKVIPCTAETLVYEVHWGPFRAGYLILTVEPVQHNKTIRLGGKALSSNFISAFYKMRDYVISTVDSEGLYPLFFEQHIREGKKYKSDRWILYDHAAKKAVIKERELKEIESPQFLHDYLSLLYQVRSMKTEPGDTFCFNIYLHKKVYPLWFQCKESKEINVDCGTFKCTLIEPKLVGDGETFNRKDRIEVWISNDSRKMPIQIKSKIKFGAISARLIYFSKI
jgi:hypothetical protein